MFPRCRDGSADFISILNASKCSKYAHRRRVVPHHPYPAKLGWKGHQPRLPTLGMGTLHGLRVLPVRTVTSGVGVRRGDALEMPIAGYYFTSKSCCLTAPPDSITL